MGRIVCCHPPLHITAAAPGHNHRVLDWQMHEAGIQLHCPACRAVQDASEAVVASLRAQFALPFVAAPLLKTGAHVREQHSSQQVVTAAAAASAEPSAASGADIRAAVSNMQLQNASGQEQHNQPLLQSANRGGAMKRPADGAVDDTGSLDFLPLPISESYQMPRKKQHQRNGDPEQGEGNSSQQQQQQHQLEQQRGSGVQQQQQQQQQRGSKRKGQDSNHSSKADRWLHDMTDWDGPASVSYGAQNSGTEAASGSTRAQDLHAHEHDNAQTGRQDQHQGPAQNRSKRSKGNLPGAAAGNPFAALVRQKQPSAGMLGQDTVHSDQPTLLVLENGTMERQAGRSGLAAGSPAPADSSEPGEAASKAAAVEAFDYSAAQAAAPGLKLWDSSSSRGRGNKQQRGRGGNTRGRGRGRGDASCFSTEPGAESVHSTTRKWQSQSVKWQA